VQPAHHRVVRGTRTGSRALRVSSALFLLTLGSIAIACTSHTSASPSSPVVVQPSVTDPNAAASAVMASLGAVPIPSAPATDPTPTAEPGHPQLLAIGAPLTAHLAGGTTALVRALGPDQVSSAPASGGKPPLSTIGVITITAKVTHGSITLAATDFSPRDQTGRPIVLTAKGAGSATATQGTTATIAIAGRFTSGAAQITWINQKSVVALWDFNIELD